MPFKYIKLGTVKTARGLMILAVLFALFYFAVNFLVGERGYFRYMKLKDEKTRLEDEIKGLKSENERLAGEIERLKSDPVYIEKLAREQGLARDGELVYQYEETPAPEDGVDEEK